MSERAVGEAADPIDCPLGREREGWEAREVVALATRQGWRNGIGRKGFFGTGTPMEAVDIGPSMGLPQWKSLSEGDGLACGLLEANGPATTRKWPIAWSRHNSQAIEKRGCANASGLILWFASPSNRAWKI